MLHMSLLRPGLLAAFPLLFDLECQPPADAPPMQEPEVRVDHIAVGLEHTCAVAEKTRLHCWGSGAHGKLGLAAVADIGDDELPYEAGDVALAGFGPIAQVVGHDAHTCALNIRGAVRCWGYGPILGRGDATSIGDDEPAGAGPTIAVGRPAVELAANALRTCALLDDGHVRCWGDNSGGELGYGHLEAIGDDELPADVPPVPLGALATAIRGGGDHFCAITDAGHVRCWGQNNDGQLGYGHAKPIGDNDTPADAGDVDLGGANVVDLAVGGAHTCALTDAGAVRCWGLNKYGQLGLGHTQDIGDDEPPAAAPALDLDADRDVVQLAAGAVHTCALFKDGGVTCWGYGVQGQLGYGDPDNIGDDEVPGKHADVDLGAPAVQIGMGTHACALLVTGKVRCWGRNGHGQLGHGHTEPIGLADVPADAGDVHAF